MWDPRSCTKIGKLKGHSENVKALVLSPDGTQVSLLGGVARSFICNVLRAERSSTY